MLLMLDGVQGVGKSTLLNELKNHFPVNMLHRTEALNELLKKAPRDFALTGEHLPLIRSIFFQWKNTLDSIHNDDTDKLWILDRGPITTLAYQSMTLDYASRKPEHFMHYLLMCDKRNKTYKAKMEYYKRQDQLDTLFGRSQMFIHDFLLHAFKHSALNRHKKVLALHIKANPNTIATRFEERRNDIRANNMQDWFINKADEIDNYDRAYRLVDKWLDHESNFSTMEYSNDGTVSQGVQDLIQIIKDNL